MSPQTYNLGKPSLHLNAGTTCTKSYTGGVMFNFNPNFVAAIVACGVVLIGKYEL